MQKQQNHFLGGGEKPEAHYPKWKRSCKPTERKPAFLDSLIKMAAVNTDIIVAASDAMVLMNRWLSVLESSNGLTHIKDILTCACVVAQCIDKREEKKDSQSTLIIGHMEEDPNFQTLGLGQRLREEGDVKLFCGMLDGLAFLPVDEVPEGLTYL